MQGASARPWGLNAGGCTLCRTHALHDRSNVRFGSQLMTSRLGRFFSSRRGLIMAFDLTVSWHWEHRPYQGTLQQFFWRVSGTGAPNAWEAAKELFSSINHLSNWWFYFSRLYPISANARAITISVHPGTTVLSYTLHRPDYHGTRLSPFFNELALSEQARIGWLTASPKRLGYSQFPWLAGSDFQNGIMRPFTWPAFNDFGMVHSTLLVGSLGDELIPCIKILGSGFMPIVDYVAYRTASRQLHRRRKV